MNNAILFDKVSTPGGDHTHLFHRLFAPLARKAAFMGGDHRTTLEKDWAAFSRQQVELLIEAGIPAEEARALYAESAGRASH